MHLRRYVCYVFVLSCLLLINTRAADETKMYFDLPSGEAAQALKKFSEMSGRETLFDANAIRGVRTAPVKGEFTAKEALERILTSTGLTVIVVQDEQSGAFAVKKITAPDASRTTAPNQSDRSAENRASSGPGEIRGQVSNAATNSNLESVSVRIRETGREYFTARDGTFAIPNLPRGNYNLTFDYPGLDRETRDVAVEGGQISQVNVALNSQVYEMAQFVVTGQREGNAAAIAEQRAAPNLTNIITADAFGDTTKANIGNLLRRLPGITGITDDEIDTSAIQVRGMDANLTSIDIDGTRAASVMNGSCRQNVNAIPVDMIEKVEVAKAPTAEDDADSLGGRVKLSTKSAFDMKQRYINFRAGISYNESYGKKITRDRKNTWPPSFGVTYADTFDVFGKPRALGIFVAANYDKFLDARSLTQYRRMSAAGGSVNASVTKDYPAFDFASEELHEQVRTGGNVRIEYKLGNHTILGLSAMYSRYQDDFDRARTGFDGGTIDMALSDPDPFYTVVNNATYYSQRNLRESKTDTYNIRLFGTTTLDGYKITYDLNNQRAKKFEFRNQTSFISSATCVYSLDYRLNSEYLQPVILDGQDPTTDRFGVAKSNALEVRRQSVAKDIWGGKIDAEKTIETRFPVTLKAGMRLRNEVQTDDQDRFVAALATAVGKDLSAYLDEDWKNAGGIGRYPLTAVPSNEKVLGSNVTWVGGLDPRTAWKFDPNFVTMTASNTVQQSLLNDRTLSEALYAGYLQGNVKFGDFSVLGGVRYERTRVIAKYGVRDRRASDVLAQFSGRARARATYDDFFPSVHFRYNITKALVMRASLSTTIGRPELDVVAANDDYDTRNLTITIPNPDLKPQRSTNYDLSIEYYFKRVGVISIGVFQKDIRDYIATVTRTISEADAADLGVPLVNPQPDAFTWSLTTDDNNGKARVRGLELNYMQQLDFLPGAFRGLGVFFNYTWLQSEGTMLDGTTTPLRNFIPRSGNIGMSYTYGRWDARLQLSYHSAYMDSYNSANPRLRTSFRGERYQWDFNGRYKINKNLSVFANLSNFTSSSEPSYLGWVAIERREKTISYSFIITGGLSVTF